MPFGIVILLAFSAWFLAAWGFHFPTEAEKLLWRVFAVYHAVFCVIGGGYYLITAFQWSAPGSETASANTTGAVLLQESAATLGANSEPPVDDGGTLIDIAVTVITTTAKTTTKTTTKTMTKTTTDVMVDDTERQACDSDTPKRRRALARLPTPRKVLGEIRWRVYGFTARWKNISPNQDPSMELPLKVIIPVTILCVLYVFSRAYIWIEDFISVRAQPVGIFIAVNRFLPWLGVSR